MTKQDILCMNNSVDINHTIITNPELWDQEVHDHLMRIVRKENLEKYGVEDVLDDPTPVRRKPGDAD